MIKLTERNLKVYQFMLDYFGINQQTPPIAVIADHFGWSSANAAQCHIEVLFEHGLIEYNENGKYKFCDIPAAIGALRGQK